MALNQIARLTLEVLPKGIDTTGKQIDDLTRKGRDAVGSMDKLSTSMDKSATAATSLGDKVKSFGSKFSGTITNVAGLSTSLLNLSRQYQDLTDTQIAVDRAQLKVSKTTENVAKTQGKLNQLTAQGVTSGANYEQAQLDVNQALEAQDLATRMLTEKQEDHQRAQENFWIGLVPTVTTAAGTIISTMKEIGGTGLGGLVSKFTGALTTIGGTGGLGGLVSKFSGVGEAVKGLGISMKTALVGTGIGAIIVGLGITLEAFANNWWGVRDAVNDMGIALGNALPGLRPVLDALGKVGEGIVSTFGAPSGTVPKAMAESSLAIKLFGDTSRASLDAALKYTQFQKRLAEEQKHFDDIMMASRNTEERNNAIAAMEKLIKEGEQLLSHETQAQAAARNGWKLYSDESGIIKETTTNVNTLSTATDGLAAATNTYVPSLTNANTAQQTFVSGNVGMLEGLTQMAEKGIIATDAADPLTLAIAAVGEAAYGAEGGLYGLAAGASAGASAMNKTGKAAVMASKDIQMFNNAMANWGGGRSSTGQQGAYGGPAKAPAKKTISVKIKPPVGQRAPFFPGASGLHQRVDRPTWFMAGEAGRKEDVSIARLKHGRKDISGEGGFGGAGAGAGGNNSFPQINMNKVRQMFQQWVVSMLRQNSGGYTG